MQDEAILELSLKLDSTLVTINSQSYRPPSWPPPPEWVISVDYNGNEKSKYGDDVWDFSDMEKGLKCNFSIGNLDERNKELFKQTLVFLAYRPKAPRAMKSTYGGMVFSNLKKLFCLCSEHKILASDVSKYPKVVESYSQKIAPTGYSIAIATFHTIFQFRSKIGFELLNEKAIIQLISLEPKNKSDTIQTPYIPPRIWNYQLSRVNEFLDDFIHYENKIIELYDLASSGYQLNIEKGFAHVSPFFHDDNRYRHRTYFGTFDENLAKFGLHKFFKKWMVPSKKESFTIQDFSSLLNLAKTASFIYILNFSLQRKSEALDLRIDCWQLEEDEKLGPIGLLVGETTKTNPDDDARWVVPPHVEKAVNTAKLISQLRVRYQSKNTPKNVRENPYLFSITVEPWASTMKNQYYYPKMQKLMGFATQHTNKLFDLEQFRITAEDWKIALTLTPNLHLKHGFQGGIGSIWKISYHQFRRTTNVNMFASSLISDVSMQWQMKHSTRIMPLYYARNYTYLRLNESTENSLVNELYRSMYRNIADVVNNSLGQYVVPHNEKAIDIQVVNLINSDEEKKLIKLIKKGNKGCRKTLLGFCMSNSVCEYGGIESISKCVGNDSKRICLEAVFDNQNKEKLLQLKSVYEQQLETIKKDSPRYKSLKEEIYAIEVYLNVVK